MFALSLYSVSHKFTLALAAIWNVLSKLEPYSAKGYLADKITEHSVVISKAQALELLQSEDTFSPMR